MNPDSLQTVIQGLTTKVDSLQNVLSEATQSIRPYITMIESQQNTYDLILVAVGLIAALVVGFNIYFSTRRTKELVKDETIKELTPLIGKKINKSFDDFEKKHSDRIAYLEGERERLFYLMNYDSKEYSIALIWAIFSINSYIKCNIPRAVRDSIDNALNLIKNNLKDQEPKEIYKSFKICAGYETIPSIIEKIPEEYFSEKDEIKDFITKVFKAEPDGNNNKTKTEPEGAS